MEDVEDQGVEDGGGEVGGEVGKTVRLLPDHCPMHKICHNGATFQPSKLSQLSQLTPYVEGNNVSTNLSKSSAFLQSCFSCVAKWLQ